MSPENFDQEGEEIDFPAQDERIRPVEDLELIERGTLGVLLENKQSRRRVAEISKADPDLAKAYNDAKDIEATAGRFTLKDGKVTLDKISVITTMVSEIVRGDDLVLKTKLKILVDKIRKGR